MVDFDIAIIGGGINGTGIARDAAGRGLKVALFEQGDLAQGTSSASTKLIHGGLRYLEYYEFRLVREALTEREVLWKIAPHIIWPLRFVLPYQKGLRPRWMIRAGLFLYDHIGGRKQLRATRSVDLRQHETGQPLKPGFGSGFEYSDCWVIDSRLVVLNARDAANRGARIATRARVTKAERQDAGGDAGKDAGGDAGKEAGWRIEVAHGDGRLETVTASVLVNAAGPWVADVLEGVVPASAPARIRLVQGSHIVVPKLYDHKRAYIFQNGDGRIVFAIPYERDFTLIGTTDLDYTGDPAKVEASEGEIDYLCGAASEYFARPVRRSDVVWTYSGVRSLYDDGASKPQEATRDYVLHIDEGAGRAPLLSIFGGKITTYRRLAEAAMEKLAPFLSGEVAAKAGWTGKAHLPGGDFAMTGFQDVAHALREQHPYLEVAMAQRLVRTYGTDAARMLAGARSIEDHGRHFGADLYERELRHMIQQEWARTGEDALWRRTKLGLSLSAAEAAGVDAFMRAQAGVQAGTQAGEKAAVTIA